MTVHGEAPMSRTGKKTRSTLFGRKDLLETYRQAKDFIVRHKLLRMCTFSDENGLKRLTICNLWRIELEASGALHTFRFNLRDAEWLQTDGLSDLPDIPFAPIGTGSQSLEWGVRLCKDALRVAIRASGADDFPEREAKWIYHAIFKKLFGGDKDKGLISTASMNSGARTLRAVWWDHFVDREVLSALLCIRRYTWSISEYLQYARHRQALLKVAAERRNLLPILTMINPSQWGRDDLFSRKLWVRDGRKSTVLDRRPVRVEGLYRIHSFESAAPWRWLSRASLPIVREWVSAGNNAVIEDLALANCGGIHAPVYAYVAIIRSANYTRFPKGYPPVLQLYRVLLKFCAQMWKEKGFSAVRQWIRHDLQSELLDMSNYLLCEGFARGLPDKNASWPSLLRRSEDWHRRIGLMHLEQAEREERLLQWDSPLPETVIDGIVCAPLMDSQALAREGYEMSHCVGGYAQLCHEGAYRVFALKESDGTRSTLGIRIGNRGGVSLEQHRGPCNSQVSRKASSAARKLLNVFRQALAEQNGKQSSNEEKNMGRKKSETTNDAVAEKPSSRHEEGAARGDVLENALINWEQRILGLVVWYPDSLFYLLKTVSPDDFHFLAHKILYETMRDMYDTKKPINLVTLAERLRGDGNLERVGGVIYLGDLAFCLEDKSRKRKKG